MNRTKIEWVKNPDGSQGYTWNAITGCLNHDNGLCKGGGFPCYAYRLANTRLAERYIANKNTASPNKGTTNLCPEAIADPFYPRFWEEREWIPIRDRRSKGIFVCDMGDLFGIGIPHEWTKKVISTIYASPQHRFYLLTKQPHNLSKWSPFPENCWMGVTVTSQEFLPKAIFNLGSIEASVKYLSIEPVLADIHLFLEYNVECINQTIDWLIIGACTGAEKEMTKLARNNNPFLTEMPYGKLWTAQPSIEWVREIVQAADRAGVPVFLKDNLLELVNYHSSETDFAFNKDGCYRQEMPGDTK